MLLSVPGLWISKVWGSHAGGNPTGRAHIESKCFAADGYRGRAMCVICEIDWGAECLLKNEDGYLSRCLGLVFGIGRIGFDRSLPPLLALGPLELACP